MNNRFIRRIGISLFILLIYGGGLASAGQIYYVDDDSPVSGDGKSWAGAYADLGRALDEAVGGDEILVAQGTYKPADTDGSREVSFNMKAGVAIRGGYAGFGATYPDDRDIRRYETILSGDLLGNDTGNWYDASRKENSLHVVTAQGDEMHRLDAVLDGFTIAGGYADGNMTWDAIWGGGLLSRYADGLRIRDCVFRGNFAALNGGGLSDLASYRWELSGCTFIGNSCGSLGGAIYLGAETTPARIVNCLVYANEAEWGGGMYIAEAYGQVENCTFADNKARDQWGGVMDHGSGVDFVSSVFWGNTCDSENIEWAQIGRVGDNPGDSSRFNYCCIQGWTGQLTGQENIDEDPLFADAPNGDYHLKSQAGRWDAAAKVWMQDAVTSPCIDAGDPTSPIMNEPFPNGGVVNMGTYGGTAEASKSYFGKSVCTAIAAGDINGDCKVDLGDFAILARHWLEAY